MITKSYLIFLGAGKSQVNAIRCANDLGINTIAIDADSNAEGFCYAKKYYNIEILYTNFDKSDLQTRFEYTRSLRIQDQNLTTSHTIPSCITNYD